MNAAPTHTHALHFNTSHIQTHQQINTPYINTPHQHVNTPSHHHTPRINPHQPTSTRRALTLLTPPCAMERKSHTVSHLP
eukprot:m.26465 g.26465  ORF g.26465 m.26465 type:complete len:80 (-) comp15414_c1_seq1:400-639(-)